MPGHVIRVAGPDDAPAIAALVNRAFEVVERFFKAGERTTPGEIAAMMSRGGFLVVDDAAADAGRLLASVFVSVDGETGYFGMLSVDPAAQKRGLGRLLTEAAEAHARASGCRALDIHVVNLREELPSYYRRFGFIETGVTLPFPDDEPTLQPCHFVVMTKTLD